MKSFNKPVVVLTVIMVILFFAFGSCKKELYDPAAKTSNVQHSITSLTDAYAVSNDTTTVITPFGPRLRSEIFTVQPGHHINYSPEGHIQIVETASGKLVKDFGVPVRSKAHLPSSNDSHVNQTNTNITPSASTANWIEWATATNYKQGANIQAFSTTWKVPSLPTTLNDGQVIFIFDGIQSPDSVSLLQPVLQYGNNGSVGGNYWSVQNWFIPGCFMCAPQFQGANIQVSPGTTLTGSMTKSGSAGSYSYTSSFGSAFSSNNLTVTNYPNVNLEYGVETLEAYNILQYSDYPPDSAVRMTTITAGTTNIVTGWGLNNPITNYGQHIKEVSNTEIDLYFHWPNPVMSQNFTKNNCTSGNGSVVTYTVPAGKYEASTLSAATALAQSDISANGQNYANTHGTCSVSINFDVSSTNTSSTTFSTYVDGNNVSGPRTVNKTSPIVVSCSPQPDGNATVVLQVSSGYMPVSASIISFWGPVTGVVSGNTITFSHCNLSVTQGSVDITLN